MIRSLLLICLLATTAAAQPRRVAVILYNFPSNPIQTYTHEEVRGELFHNSRSTDGFYRENSFGKMWLSGHFNPDGDVYGWYTIASEGGCDPSGWIGEARALAASDGFDAANYEHVIAIAATYPSGCSSGINGAFGANIRLFGNVFGWKIVSHELGHCLGIQHAWYRQCFDGATPVSISNTCNYVEYGDVIDIMGDGGSRGHLNAYNKWRWLDPWNSLTINSASQAGTYTITPLEAPSNGLQVLRIPRTASEYYHLEYRQPIGYDSNVGSSASITNGVSIRLAPPQQGGRSYLLSMVPPQFSIHTVGLTSDNTFTDPLYGIHVTTNSASVLGVSVTVGFDGTCVAQTPTLSVSPPIQTGTAGDTLTYTVTLTNNDSIGCAPRTVTINSTLPNKLTQSPASFTETLAPAATVERSIAVTSAPSAQSRDYTFTQYFGSGKNKVSRTATYTVQ